MSEGLKSKPISTEISVPHDRYLKYRSLLTIRAVMYQFFNSYLLGPVSSSATRHFKRSSALLYFPLSFAQFRYKLHRYIPRTPPCIYGSITSTQKLDQPCTLLSHSLLSSVSSFHTSRTLETQLPAINIHTEIPFPDPRVT